MSSGCESGGDTAKTKGPSRSLLHGRVGAECAGGGLQEKAGFNKAARGTQGKRT